MSTDGPAEPVDTDGDPEQLNPRDLRDTESRDDAAEADEDTDGDPQTLNPRGD